MRESDSTYSHSSGARLPARLIDRVRRIGGRRSGQPSEPEGRLLVEQLPLVTYVETPTPGGTALHPSRQVEALLGPDWLEHDACRDPLILLGDFNAVPSSRAYRRLAARLSDAQRAVPAPRRRATYPTRAPLLCLDHVFVSGSVEVLGVETLRTPAARVASDHLPLAVDFRVLSRGGDRLLAKEPC